MKRDIRTAHESATDFHGRLAASWELKYEERRSFKARERLLMGLLKRACRPGSVWLDAGCGTGRFSRRLVELGAGRVWGLDSSVPMLDEAGRLAARHRLSDRIAFQRCDQLAQTGFPDCSFGGILCSSVLEYLENPEAVLREFHRILAAQGGLIVSLPNRTSFLRRIQNVCFRATKALEFHPPVPGYLALVRNQYVRSEACGLIERAGFRITGMRYGGTGLRLDAFALWGPLMFIEAEKAEPPAAGPVDGAAPGTRRGGL